MQRLAFEGLFEDVVENLLEWDVSSHPPPVHVMPHNPSAAKGPSPLKHTTSG